VPACRFLDGNDDDEEESASAKRLAALANTRFGLKPDEDDEEDVGQ
jgi:hypothetical protein